jgi:predicted MFS family arabinose efflux permease
MLVAGLLFDVGVVLMASAQNFLMLIGGRILLGVAVAFASVAVTLYNSEMAPAHMRGRLNQIFQVSSPGQIWD